MNIDRLACRNISSGNIEETIQKEKEVMDLLDGMGQKVLRFTDRIMQGNVAYKQFLNKVPLSAQEIKEVMQLEISKRFQAIFGVAPEKATKKNLPELCQALEMLKYELKGIQEIALMEKPFKEFLALKNRVTSTGIHSYCVNDLQRLTSKSIPKITSASALNLCLHYLKQVNKSIENEEPKFLLCFGEKDRKDIETYVNHPDLETQKFAQNLILCLDYDKSKDAFANVSHSESLSYFNQKFFGNEKFKQNVVPCMVSCSHSQYLAAGQLIKDMSGETFPKAYTDHVVAIIANMKGWSLKSQAALYDTIYPLANRIISKWKSTQDTAVRLKYVVTLKKLSDKLIEQESIENKPNVYVRKGDPILWEEEKKKAPKKKGASKLVERCFLIETESVEKESDPSFKEKLKVSQSEELERTRFEFFDKPPIIYTDRVLRWFVLNLKYGIPFDEYREIKDSVYLEKTIIRHRFSTRVDHFAFDPNFCYVDGDCRHLLVVHEYPDGKVDFGATTYHFTDKEHTICDHRFHTILNLDDLIKKGFKGVKPESSTAPLEDPHCWTENKDECWEDKKCVVVEDKSNGIHIRILKRI